jgi:hypothetical protein
MNHVGLSLKSSTRRIVAAVAITYFTFLFLPATRAWAVRVFGLLGYYGLCYFIVRQTSTYKTARKMLSANWAALLLTVIVFAVFSWWYFSLYHFVPIWDQIGYWRKTIDFNRSLDARPFHTILGALQSVNTQDYNLLQCWIMSMPVKLNSSWTFTFFSELVLINIPVAFVLTSFVVDKVQPVSYVAIAVFIFMLINPVLLYPIFYGSLDEVGVLLLVCVMAAIFDDSFIKRSWDLIVVGVGIVGIVLLRRWFIYGVLPLVIICFAYWILYFLRNNNKQTLQDILQCVAKTCVGAVAVLVPFRGFIIRSISGNYSEQYHAWTNIDKISDKFINAINHFGWIWIIISALALAYCIYLICNHDMEVNRSSIYIAFLFAVASVCGCLMFWHTQDFSAHHYYFFAPYILVSMSIPVVEALTRQKIIKLRTLFAVMCSILSVVGCCNAFGMLGKSKDTMSLLPKMVIEPPVDSGYEAKYQLVHDIEHLAGSQQKVYFACASLDMNSSVLNSISCSEHSKSTSVNYRFADVDSRDGFNTDFFTCDYVIATDPVSLHMAASNEQVVSTLNEGILDSSSTIGKHYSLIKSYRISSCEVYVYELTTPWTYDEVNEVAQYFEQLYPQWPSLLKERFDKYLSSMGE